MQHVHPARCVCAAAVLGPLACLADPLQERQEREGGQAGFGVVRQLLQGRQDLHTCTSWCSNCWLLQGTHIGGRHWKEEADCGMGPLLT